MEYLLGLHEEQVAKHMIHAVVRLRGTQLVFFFSVFGVEVSCNVSILLGIPVTQHVLNTA